MAVSGGSVTCVMNVLCVDGGKGKKKSAPEKVH